ncbi:hypothetical protein Caci_4351 [Catenulispora acidiphila DSM 44928]|uniref:DUF4436 domain-containing protein n=1 Tax=Catenulispora acidiphila (strain DSM 44928 / JCM 14897 / NBRC 102108 / NRRL B-24433 / ID139908) TaxID=479433 RepID=C7QJX7_CATAD|nr:DUF4436 family protein [Catenulispora acidiphila]ACU73215.1 hypothetical protein Caci_4351 [Catenulispora acidiphila DSM 44928]
MDDITPQTSGRNRIAAAIVGLTLLTAAYAYVIVGFVHSGGAHHKAFAPIGGAPADGFIDLQATMLTVDPVMNSYKMRLNFTPTGSWAGTGHNTLAKPLSILVDDVGGAKNQKYTAGQTIPISDATLDAIGETDTYPVDRHSFTLDVHVRDENGAPVPVLTRWASSSDDWALTPTMSAEAGPGDVILDVDARRSSSVLIMAFGLMTVLGLLVVVNVAMVVRAIRLRKVEFTTLAALAATLFAIPGIRNGMPTTPPVGTLADFLVFFWALMIIGLCLVAAALSWLRNSAAAPKQG